MFTLKLYRRKHPDSMEKMHKVMAVERIVALEIGDKAIELQAFTRGQEYETYFVGAPSEGMDAYGRDDLHLGTEPSTWWGWGLLENSEGRTSEHYRPHNYG